MKLRPRVENAGRTARRASRTWIPVLGLIAALPLAIAGDTPPRKISQAANAWEVWTEMTRSSLTFEPIEFEISPSAGAVSFGGEKEGGDALITRIMSPSEKDMDVILGTLRPDRRKEFLADLLNGLSRGRYQVDGPIVSATGEKIPLPKLPEAKQYGRMALPDLLAEYKAWIGQTRDRPFSFLVEQAKFDIFDGKFAGMGQVNWIDRAMKAYPRALDFTRSEDPIPTHFNDWRPNFGEPENYISRMVTEQLGDWELNFKPKTSFGEFEQMMSWFKNALKDEEGPYANFGHQWLVLPKKPLRGSARRALARNQLAEVYKATQALITLRGMEMKSGILTSMYNEVRADDVLKSHNTERSVLRLKDNLFRSNLKADALNIEQRSGTSFNPTRRLVQKSIVSRYASDDWSGLADAGSYQLIPEDPRKITGDLASRFNVTPFEAKRCLERIGSIAFEGDEVMVQGLRASSLAPFWNWDAAPFVSPVKKALAKKVTRNFIQQIAAAPATKAAEDVVLEAFARWSAIVDFDTDIENYLRPRPQLYEKAKFGELLTQRARPRVNVNDMEFGIEYTARFPMRASSIFTEEPLKLGQKGFLRLEYDLTPDEKREIIRTIAEKLAVRLNNGKKVQPTRVDSAGHGHKIAITYELADAKGRTWRVEWDGIGRDYDVNGNVLTGSERGGVVEVVTPKYKPDAKSVEHLYAVFDEMGMHPSFFNGGGHVNFDLAVFDGKPKRLARLIAVFLENRDVITTLFQHPGRFSTAEPHDVDGRFLDQLRNFDGTEEDLKKLLYNERFFNTRLGRKTKYVQLELSSYFQDVIPEEFVTKDFDIKNDVWRRQFRVSPKVRKGEFRLFGAPRTVEEAHLQLKFVRALMDKALNDDQALNGELAKVDLDEMVKDAPAAFQRFQSTMAELGLDPREYEGFYAEGLQNVDQYVSSAFYEPYETKMKLFQKTDGWLRAVKARPEEKGLASKERFWNIEDADAEALALKKQKDGVKLQAEYRRREEFGLKRGDALEQTWREYDRETVARIKRLPWAKMRQTPEIAIDFVYERYIQPSPRGSSEHRRGIALIVDDLAQYAKRQDGAGSVPLPEILVRELERMDFKADPSRYAFYCAMVLQTLDPSAGGKAAIERLGPIARVAGDRQAFNLFVELMRDRNEYEGGWRALFASQSFRRVTYGLDGSGRFETAWGDFFEAATRRSMEKPSTRVTKLEGEPSAVRFRESLFDLATGGGGYVTFGAKEKALILAYEQKIQSRYGHVARLGLKDRSLANVLNRKCNLLLKDTRK